MNLALKVNDTDNVATIFAVDVRDGDEVIIRDKAGKDDNTSVLGDVPYGHKLAVKDIRKGEDIIKYGEAIGIATANIVKGEYVHVHNLDSKRARGDWEQEAGK